MKTEAVAKDSRKKVLLLSDDLRTPSGVGTISKSLVLGLAHKYNFAQMGGAVKHAEFGKVIDASQLATERGVKDAYIRIYPVNGYGTQDILRQVMRTEKPDVIVHFTDPRFWASWLYPMEREIRQYCPLAYLNIWDSLPYPNYNRPYYESSDLLLAITKQTYNVNKWVLRPENCQDINGNFFDSNGNTIPGHPTPLNKTMLHHCPHGVDTKIYTPLPDSALGQAKKALFGNAQYDFVVFYNSRNIRRKQPGSIILAFKAFCDSLPEEKAKRCALVMHTNPTDENGLDLLACRDTFCPNRTVIFSTDKVPTSRLNEYYNIADVTIHLSDNEGFGIGTCESLSAGTPIIVTATGGLQDQCGFTDDAGNPIAFTEDWGTNSDGRYKNHGKWVTPVYPSARMVQGSLPTPYILAEYGKWEDATVCMKHWYDMDRSERKVCGLAGREYISTVGGLNIDNMCDTFVEGVDAIMKSWRGRERFNLHKMGAYNVNTSPTGKLGIVLPKVA